MTEIKKEQTQTVIIDLQKTPSSHEKVIDPDDDSVMEIEAQQFNKIEKEVLMNNSQTAKMPQLVEKVAPKDIRMLNNVQTERTNRNRRQPLQNQQKNEIIHSIEEYIPQCLLALGQVNTDMIMVGERHQATVKPYRQKDFPLKTIENPLKWRIWNKDKDFDNDIFQLFKRLYGQHRTTQELCTLFGGLGVSWPEMQELLVAKKKHLKEYYNNLDANMGRY